MKHTRKKSKGMKRHMLLLPVFLLAVAALILVAAAPNSWAEDDGDEIPFSEANIFFELNDTDGDLGIHASIDGEPWKKLEIEGPRERELLTIYVQGRLRRQGLTQLFFESAEPTFDELSPERFFRRFREGEYEIEGRTLEGEELESIAVVTHVMPSPPDDISVSGTGIEPDEVDCDEGPPMVEPEDNGDVIISWAPVITSHPEIGRTREAVEVVKYQLVVEREEPTLLIYSVDLPPEVTEFSVPDAFIELGDEFKFEILVREASGNQTAVESCFVIAEENGE